MRKYYIYKATNKINGMSYIGQSIHPEERIQQHCTDRRNKNSIFHRAIDKYSPDNFAWEILVKVDGKENADKAEKHFIKREGTFKPNGYNMTKGGDGGSMWNVKPVVQLTLDGEYVNKFESSSEAGRHGFNSTDVNYCCRGKLQTCKGYIFMFESDYLENGPRKLVKHMPNNARAVIQCDLDGNMIKRFPLIADAEKELGIGHSCIVSCAKGKNKTAHGFIFVYEEDFPIKDLEKRTHRKKGRKVAKVDKNTGEILGTYDRMSDAARELGGSHKMIFKAVDNPNKTAYGFKWISL